MDGWVDGGMYGGVVGWMDGKWTLMLDSWSRDRTTNLTVMGRPALPTELQTPGMDGGMVGWMEG